MTAADHLAHSLAQASRPCDTFGSIFIRTTGCDEPPSDIKVILVIMV
ncbi:uncharacterized protein UHO2_00350 [Ustilago hordei]|nr:uncharacterized protein UHO2_00350 [Ustilago hordei]SYW81845.1 uncharacterized protein UHO2_00350 [Ustilago hordei]